MADPLTRVVNVRAPGVLDALRRGDPRFVYIGRRWWKGGVVLLESDWEDVRAAEAEPFGLVRDDAAHRCTLADV